jgi:hypothetical protein
MFFFSFFFRSKDVYTMFGSYYRAYLCQKFHMSTNTAYYYLISGIYFLFYLCFSYTKKSVLEYKMCLSNIFYCIVSTNRSLYSVMYNMEIFCTRPYCIENPYWTRRLRRNMGFQYNTDSYNIFPYCT